MRFVKSGLIFKFCASLYAKSKMYYYFLNMEIEKGSTVLNLAAGFLPLEIYYNWEQEGNCFRDFV